jgi:3'-phosphoadenosine 5'-phosphosulfate sulfotransferase (PAPS reductase)/FAD synthetase
MRDPYKIEGPALISFSGGRSSGYMLRQILNAYKEKLPDNIHVVFTNTGKEAEQTLDFIHKIEVNWGVAVHWIERAERKGKTTRYREVNYKTASRKGEPFTQLLLHKSGLLPNPVTRFCTVDLKIKPAYQFMTDQGYDEWARVLGLRHDEPHRVHRSKAQLAPRERECLCPMHDAKAGVKTVMAFWRRNDFDLDLKQWEGNCDLCFLKAVPKIVAILQDDPSKADWWIEEERQSGLRKCLGTFRKDLPVAKLLEIAQKQSEGFFPRDRFDVDTIDCGCTD